MAKFLSWVEWEWKEGARGGEDFDLNGTYLS